MSVGGELECYAVFIPGDGSPHKDLGRIGYSHPHWLVRWLGNLEIRLRRELRELEEINEKNKIRKC